jgi:Family of unknown function (DUF6879)
MELISAKERRDLISGIKHEALHMEMRDFYAGDLEMFSAWQTDGTVDLTVTEQWCAEVRAGVAAGRVYRRACVVSEPLSDYQRWAYLVTDPQVEAGEDLRWVPRRLLSTVALPGNDFWLLDNEVAVFGIFSGAHVRVEIQLYRDPAVVSFCRNAFETAWAVSISHRDYRPA